MKGFLAETAMGCETLPPRYLGLRNLFVDMSCNKNWAEKRKTRDIDQLFGAAIKIYKAWCEDHERRYGIDWLTDRDSRVPAADIVFTLVSMFSSCFIFFTSSKTDFL